MDTAPCGTNSPAVYDSPGPSLLAHDRTRVDTGAGGPSPIVEIELARAAPGTEASKPGETGPDHRRREQPRSFEHIFWKWVFRAATLSGIITMILTLILVLR